MTNRTKPRVRVHTSIGKFSKATYWWVAMANDPDPYRITNQRHCTPGAAWEQFCRRHVLGLT